MSAIAATMMIIAAQAAPALPERFADIARTQDMVRLCAKLDRAPATRARVARAHMAANTVLTRARSVRRAADVAQGRRDWAALRGDVDTSCIVGPGETGRTAYADLITDYERATRNAGTALSSLPKGR